MKTINATTARKNLYQVIADVNESSNPVIITNSKGKNAVLISEQDWQEVQETVYLYSVPGLAESINEARHEPIDLSLTYKKGEEW